MLTLDKQSALSADHTSSAIRESGKYIGVITRAEKITSKNGTAGLGLSFKSDSGETADYLDLYIGETDGKPWASKNTVNAILCCLKMRGAQNGPIKIEKYNKTTKQREVVQADGYPELMGKRIGLLLKQELTTYKDEDKTKLVICGVFEPQTELTASEILSGITQPAKLAKMVQALMSNPVDDRRSKPGAVAPANHAPAKSADAFADFDSDIPF